MGRVDQPPERRDLRWEQWTVALRLDSAVYDFRPADRNLSSFPANQPAGIQSQVQQDNESRYKNSIYPAKLWATYSAPGVEVTAGDCVRAVRARADALDAQGRRARHRHHRPRRQGAGHARIRSPSPPWRASPTRRESTRPRAASLWVTSDLGARATGATPVYGSDRLVGIDLQAGRGLPVTLSTHFVALLAVRAVPLLRGTSRPTSRATRRR